MTAFERGGETFKTITGGGVDCRPYAWVGHDHVVGRAKLWRTYGMLLGASGEVLSIPLRYLKRID